MSPPLPAPPPAVPLVLVAASDVVLVAWLLSPPHPTTGTEQTTAPAIQPRSHMRTRARCISSSNVSGAVLKIYAVLGSHHDSHVPLLRQTARAAQLFSSPVRRSDDICSESHSAPTPRPSARAIE